MDCQTEEERGTQDQMAYKLLTLNNRGWLESGNHGCPPDDRELKVEA